MAVTIVRAERGIGRYFQGVLLYARLIIVIAARELLGARERAPYRQEDKLLGGYANLEADGISAASTWATSNGYPVKYARQAAEHNHFQNPHSRATT